MEDGAATASWALAPGTPPGSYCEDTRETPSRLWQEAGNSDSCEIHSEPLLSKGQLYGGKLGEGHSLIPTPSSLPVSTKNEVMGEKPV